MRERKGFVVIVKHAAKKSRHILVKRAHDEMWLVQNKSTQFCIVKDDFCSGSNTNGKAEKSNHQNNQTHTHYTNHRKLKTRKNNKNTKKMNLLKSNEADPRKTVTQKKPEKRYIKVQKRVCSKNGKAVGSRRKRHPNSAVFLVVARSI